MKDINIDVKEIPKFSPIEIRFTLQSKEEFNELWARLNLAHNYIVDNSGNCRYSNKAKELLPLTRISSLMVLWNQLNEIVGTVNQNK